MENLNPFQTFLHIQHNLQLPEVKVLKESQVTFLTLLVTMDYRIKKVGDEWEFLPKKERDEKREYERLLNNINKREKKIISDQEKIKTSNQN